jgi:hypothetical protein
MKRPPDRQRFHHAVIVVARYRARKQVEAAIRARGQKVSQFTAREIADLSETYLRAHLGELITKATADCLTFPEFAGCAELLSDAQLPGRCSDTTISVQNPSAEVRAER